MTPDMLASITIEEALSALEWLSRVVGFADQYNGRDGAGLRRDDVAAAARILWQFWTMSRARPGKLWRKDGSVSKGVAFLMDSLDLIGLQVTEHQIVEFDKRWKE